MHPAVARSSVRPRIELAAAAVLFGLAFVPASRAVEDLTPWSAVAIRFIVASIVALGLAGRATTGTSRRHGTEPLTGGGRTVLIAGAAAGAVNVVGFCTLSLALERTSASNAAFLSSMSVVVVPAVAVAIGARRAAPGIVGGVVLAVLGSFLLSGATLRIGGGDALAITDAFIAAAHIALVGHWAPRVDAAAFNRTQLTASALFALPLVAFGGAGDVTSTALVAAATCGVLQVAALGLQVRAQAGVDATSASVILLLVPVAGALASMALLGERLDGRDAVGAVAILAAVIVAELLPARDGRPRVASATSIPETTP